MVCSYQENSGHHQNMKVMCECCFWVVWGLYGCKVQHAQLTAMMESGLEKAPKSPPLLQKTDSSCIPNTTANRSGMTSGTTANQTVWTEDPEHNTTNPHTKTDLPAQGAVNMASNFVNWKWQWMTSALKKDVFIYFLLFFNSLVNCSLKPKSINVNKAPEIHFVLQHEIKCWCQSTKIRWGKSFI